MTNEGQLVDPNYSEHLPCKGISATATSLEVRPWAASRTPGSREVPAVAIYALYGRVCA